MFIKQIKSFDKDSNEADIIVSDGTFDLTCYCHPSDLYKAGTEVKLITSLFTKNIMRAENEEFSIFKLKDFYAYHLQGKIMDLTKSNVCIGNLEITIDGSIPNDIKSGEFIEFDVLRLDCCID